MYALSQFNSYMEYPMLTNKVLRRLYQSDVVYKHLSNWQLRKAHTARYILASMELWNRGLIDNKTIYQLYLYMNTAIIRNSYKVAKERGY